MNRIARLTLFHALIAFPIHAFPSSSECPDDPSQRAGHPLLCVGDASRESGAVFGRYDVFGSISRTEDQESPNAHHQGLLDLEFIFERGGTGAVKKKSQSHVLSASLVKNTLGEAHGILNGVVFAPGAGDVMGQQMNLYGGGSWLSSDEGIVAYRTFVTDVGRIAKGTARYDAGDASIHPKGLTLDSWRRIGEGNLIVFHERATQVLISGYEDGTWKYSKPGDRDFSGLCFAHDATAFRPKGAKRDEQTYQWLPIDADGLGTFSTEQLASDRNRDVHVPLSYPTRPGRARVAPCERVAYIDRSENEIGLVAAVNPDWTHGDDRWNEPSRHPARNSCRTGCEFQVVPIPNGQIMAYKAITSHRLGSPNPDAILGYSAVCARSSYDCDAAYDLRSNGSNLDGSSTKWKHGLHSRRGAVGILAAMQTSVDGREAFGEIDISDRDGKDVEVEVFRVRKNRKSQSDAGLWVDLDEKGWRVGDRPLLVGGTLRDGGVCRWDQAAREIDCSGGTASLDMAPAARPVALGSTDRFAGTHEDAEPREIECHRETFFDPTDAHDHHFLKLPYPITLESVDCIAEGGGEIALSLLDCDAAGGSCISRHEPLSCDGDGASALAGVEIASERWIRVELGAPAHGAVRSLTLAVCGTAALGDPPGRVARR